MRVCLCVRGDTFCHEGWSCIFLFDWFVDGLGYIGMGLVCACRFLSADTRLDRCVLPYLTRTLPRRLVLLPFHIARNAYRCPVLVFDSCCDLVSQATLRCFRGERYLEVDADLGSSLATSQASKGECTRKHTCTTRLLSRFVLHRCMRANGSLT